jgi:peptidoglycan/LPS O-acetylase OafA/YrhL
MGNKAQFKYMPYLDGLRAGAILLVMLWHAEGVMGRVGARFAGWAGVDIFFVISGFLITSLLLREQDTYGAFSFKQFYVRRALRIIPAYVAFLLAILLVRGWASLRAVGICAIYLTDYDLALGWDITRPFGLGHTWSLAVEEQFYLAWPLLLYVSGRKARRVAVGLIAAVAVWKVVLLFSGVKLDRLYNGFDTRLDALMIGCLAASLWAVPKIQERIRLGIAGSWMPLLALAAVFCLVQALGFPDGSRYYLWVLQLPFLSMLVALLIVALMAHPTSFLARLLSTPLLVWVGRLSYSLYLWHMLGYQTARDLGRLLSGHLPGGGLWAGDGVTDGLGIVLSFGLACLSYYFVERPFLRLKNLWQRTAQVVERPEHVAGAIRPAAAMLPAAVG